MHAIIQKREDKMLQSLQSELSEEGVISRLSLSPCYREDVQCVPKGSCVEGRPPEWCYLELVGP